MFFFTDVDTLCMTETTDRDFRQNGDRYVFFVASDHTSPVLADRFVPASDARPRDSTFLDWFYAMNWCVFQLLGLKDPPFYGAIDACVIWSQKILKKLKRCIEQRYGMPWNDAVVCQFAAFILQHRECLVRVPDPFRSVAFRRDKIGNPASSENPGFDELYHSLRLGFSEWQLYAYFLSTLDTIPYRAGMLGPAKNPIVAEYNRSNSGRGVPLPEILLSFRKGEKRFPNFMYWYPGVLPDDLPLLNEFLDRSDS
jgi:hypothetical protein